MKYITSWLFDKIDPRYQRCIDTQRKALPDIEYEFIDRKSAIVILTEANDTYNGINPINDFFTNHSAACDYIRVFLMAKTPFLLWLDADVEITGKLPVFGDAPGMEYHPESGMYSNGIVYNGNQTEIFDEYCAFWFRMKSIHLLWDSTGLIAERNNFIQYTPDWFIHHQYRASE